MAGILSSKRSRPLAAILILALALSMVMAGAGVAYAAPTPGYDPVSIQEGAPVKIVWDYTPTPYQGTVVSVDGSGYIPTSYLLWIENYMLSSSTISAFAPATVKWQEDAADGNSSAYLVDIGDLTATQPAVQVTITNSQFQGDGTYVVTSPPHNGSAGGTNPVAVDGYLPLGQYASGTGWGSISKDNKNNLDYASLPDYQTEVKGISGMESTGVSLGAGGGYVQYEFAQPVPNAATNPYGVDFIVYGNAFANNAEAGAVQVSIDGTTWYELAGSLYYDADTQRNVDVSYRLQGASAVQYKFGPTGGGTPIHDWDIFVNNDHYWPRYNGWDDTPAGENYSVASGVNGPYTPATVSASSIKVDYTSDSDPLTYKGVTLVTGTRDTSQFAFGYADVHANGSSYG
ncbi:MAG: hypothetical protein LBD12_03395, partial [Clostridiales Family XIII bacterium]|nr:hypothetical protein [Clostridiales Family XIII bacterium]